MESRASKTGQNQTSVVIETTPERVFAALTDVASQTDWARGPEEIRNLSESPARMGTTWQQVGKIVGKSLVAECQVDRYEENRTFGFSGDKPFPFRVVWELEPNGSGTQVSRTQVTMTGQFEPGGFFKMAAPLLRSSMQSQMKSDMLSLKAVLEAED